MLATPGDGYAGGMSIPRPVEGLARVPAYVPGKRLVGEQAVKLSSNENPYPALPSVELAVAQAAKQVNRYPDLAAIELTQALAAHHQVQPDQVVVGTGSSGVLYAALQAFSGPGDEVVFPWRSFEAYPIAVAVAAARAVPVPLRPDWHHDLPALLAACTPATRVMLLCSPNNPTGTAIGAQQLQTFLTQVPEKVLVVLDQAYVEFITDPQAQLPVEALLAVHPNLLLLRTFSKAYGLAGLRVGYAIAHPQVAHAVRQASVPFGVSGLAQVAALASLQPGAVQQELNQRVQQVVLERERLHRELIALLGRQVVVGSQANYCWLALEQSSQLFSQHCLQAQVAVRPFAADSWWPHAGVRVSVGSGQENDRLLQVASTFAVAAGE